MILYIAEIGMNHNGDLSLAKEMVDAAQESGALAIKFQSINAKRLISKHAAESKIDGFGFKNVKTVGEFWNKVSIDKSFHYEIKKYCDQKNIEFLSTPFDFFSVDLLDELGVRRFKVASGDLTHYPLLKKIAQKNKPIILSTGMASIDEIQNAVDFCHKSGIRDLTLLHCLSLYPTPPELSNLNTITVLKNRFKLPVGFSDHTIGYHVPIAAIAIGATIIEKHFTIDNNLPGPDQKLSATSEIFSKMVTYGNEVYESLKEKDKVVSDDEIKMRNVARRSIVAARGLEKGKILSFEDLDYKRPGSGVSAKYYEKFLGKKIVREIKKDEKIDFCDITV